MAYERSGIDLSSTSPLLIMAAAKQGGAQPSASPIDKPSVKTRSIYCAAAVERVEEYVRVHGLNYTEFANQAKTSDKTLRSFRTNKRIRSSVLDGIANAMGLTREKLING
jgi:hypothetical protein